MMQSKNGNEYFLVYDNLFSKIPVKAILNGREQSLPLKLSGAKALGPMDEDYFTYANEYTDFIESYGGCHICVGIADNVSDFFSYIAEAGALGAMVGGAVAGISGESAAAMLFAMGFGWLTAVGFATAFSAGWVAGTWLYSEASDWNYQPHP